VPATRKLLARRRCGGYNDRLTGKLLPQAFQKSFDGFDFSNGNRMHPDRSMQLGQFQKAQPVGQSWKIFAKPKKIDRNGQDKSQQEAQRIYEIHARRRVYFFIWRGCRGGLLRPAKSQFYKSRDANEIVVAGFSPRSRGVHNVKVTRTQTRAEARDYKKE